MIISFLGKEITKAEFTPWEIEQDTSKSYYFILFNKLVKAVCIHLPYHLKVRPL
jgi:hypothetical protein